MGTRPIAVGLGVDLWRSSGGTVVEIDVVHACSGSLFFQFKSPGYGKHLMTRWRCDRDVAINIVAVGESGTRLYPHAGGECR